MIAYLIFFSTATVFILIDVFSLKNYTLQSETVDFNTSFMCQTGQNCTSTIIEEYIGSILNSTTLFIKNPGNNSLQCREFMTATLSYAMYDKRAKEIYILNTTSDEFADGGGCVFSFGWFKTMKD